MFDTDFSNQSALHYILSKIASSRFSVILATIRSRCKLARFARISRACPKSKPILFEEESQTDPFFSLKCDRAQILPLLSAQCRLGPPFARNSSLRCLCSFFNANEPTKYKLQGY